jgi:DNA-binding PadR family transcriptional regulator
MSADNELTKFQMDLLTVLSENPRSGARALKEIEEQYGRSLPHGRVYQNLDDLQEKGLIVKDEQKIDDRTHLFAVTEEGFEVAREYGATVWNRVAYPDQEYIRTLASRDR